MLHPCTLMHICTNGGVAVELDTFASPDAATWTRNPFPTTPSKVADAPPPAVFCLGKCFDLIHPPPG